MEKDPNPAEDYFPPPIYHQQQSPDYSPASQAGYVQPRYAPLPNSGQPGTYVVTHQNVQPATQVTIIRTRPNNYLGLAIFVTLCCCLPFGIVGIIYSVDSSNKFDRGDSAGSEESANSAKGWSIAGIVCGIILITIYVILHVMYFASTSYDPY